MPNWLICQIENRSSFKEEFSFSSPSSSKLITSAQASIVSLFKAVKCLKSLGRKTKLSQFHKIKFVDISSFQYERQISDFCGNPQNPKDYQLRIRNFDH